MQVMCYAIKDKKANLFNLPFWYKNLVECMRNVEVACNDRNSNLNRFSHEYALYLICSMDDETGAVLCSDEPNMVCEIASLIKEVQK